MDACPSVLTYKSVVGLVSLPCQGDTGHDPKCYYVAEDGSRAEWDLYLPEGEYSPDLGGDGGLPHVQG